MKWKLAAIVGLVAALGLAIWMWHSHRRGEMLRGLTVEDPEVRLAAVRQLGREGGAPAAALEGACADEDPRVAAAAIGVVGRRRDAQSRRLLRRLSREGRTDAGRGAAAAALGDLPAADLRLLTDVLTGDPGEAAREGAGRGLLRAAARDPAAIRNNPDCLRRLVAALGDASCGVRVAAISTINRAIGVRFNFQAEAPAALRRGQVSAIESYLRQRGLL